MLGITTLYNSALQRVILHLLITYICLRTLVFSYFQVEIINTFYNHQIVIRVMIIIMMIMMMMSDDAPQQYTVYGSQN